MMSDRRPKPGESEEDILKFQEEFMRRKRSMGDAALVGSTVVVRVDRRADEAATPISSAEASSTVASKRLKTKKAIAFAADESADMLMDTSDHNPPLDTVLCDVVERNVELKTVSAPLAPPSGQSFPVVHRCDPKNLMLIRKATMSGKYRSPSRSIFSQQMLKQKRDGVGDESRVLAATPIVIVRDANECTSCAVDGTGLDKARSELLAMEIHKENLATLSKMSAAEILEQQRQLTESVDPKVLEFVKLRRHQKKIEQENTKPISMAIEETKDERVQTSKNNAAVVSTIIDSVGASKWLNMDKVETDKLAWTRSLNEIAKPSAELKIQDGYPARFDFDGAIVSREADIPVHQGLHHHGDEPEIAGYTLEELFIYGRSSILQQRVLALTTLGRILERNGAGDYDECFTAPEQFLPKLIDSGLVLLLRWALDDNTESCLIPTVAAIHALLVSAEDEYFLDRTFSWSRGEEQPYMQPKNLSAETKAKDSGNGDEVGELSDAELVRLDVASGLIRMDVLPRLRYVLEVLRPSSSPTLVIHSLAIITRLARHSLTAANTVANCPRLIETVVREFMPKSWTSTIQCAGAYGHPVREAVKLMRTLASTGRHLASEVLRRYDLITSLLCYASADPSDDSQLLQLSLEAYRTWKVFLRFGLAVQEFSDFYPLIVRQLQFYQSLCLNVDVQTKIYECDHASELIGLLTVVVPIAAAEDGGLSCSLVTALQLPIELCLKKWLWEMANADYVTSASLKLVGVTCTFVATFYEALRMKASCDSVDLIARIDDLFSLAMVPFLQSNGFRNHLACLSDASFLLCEWRNGSSRNVPALPLLGSLCWAGHLNPVLCDSSPLPLVGHLIHSLLIFKRLHAGLRNKVYALIGSLLFDSIELSNYLGRISSVSREQLNWFSRFETHFVCDLLTLMSTTTQLDARSAVYHGAATALLQQFQVGDETMAIELLSSVIFNVDLIRIELDDINVRLQKLKVDEERPSMDHTSSASDKRTNLLRQTISNLPNVCSTYVSALRAKFSSTRKFTNETDGIQTLMVNFLRGPIIESDCFEYSMIADLFAANSMAEKQSIEHVSNQAVVFVIHSLQWCHLVECIRKQRRTRAESKFCYLAMVTLISSDIFLDPCVQSYLQDCVLLMSERMELTTMDLATSHPVPEIASFHDFYEQLVLQFEAVSYGDHLFCSFVLVPMQMRYPVRLRRMVWSVEHRSALRTVGLRPDQLSIPISEFLEPSETDAVLIDCFLSALLNDQVRPNWCPLLYLVAIHHVHRFLFSAIVSEHHHGQVCDMLKRLRRTPAASDVFRHLTMYRRPNPSTGLLFDLADSPDVEVMDRLAQFG